MNSIVEIFLFCYNESIIIRQTIEHYKRLIPRCSITILDNKSSDGCTDIARQLGCKVVPFDTQNQMNDRIHTVMRNQYWKKIRNKWVIFADMDEWLYITQNELLEEDRKGTTVLKLKGFHVVGDSKMADCSDIDLHRLTKVRLSQEHHKIVCFKSGPIMEMNYSDGAHSCNPTGNVRWSDREYILVHMDYLGLPYKLHKQSMRFARSHQNRGLGLGVHYAIPDEVYINDHQNAINNSEDIYELLKAYF